MDFWKLWSDYPDPHEQFPGPVIEAGFYVNMNLKLMVIYDPKLKKELKRLNFNSDWKIVSPIVNFKHTVSITIISEAILGKPDYIQI